MKNTLDSSELTVNDLIIKANNGLRLLYKNKKQIIALMIIATLIGFFISKYQDTTYTASLTFVVEESGSGNQSLGGLASIAGQFGFDINAGSNSSLLSGDNIILYMKTPTLLRDVLLSKYDNENTLADIYIKEYGYLEKWVEKNVIKNKLHKLNKKNISNRLNDSLLKVISEPILEKQLLITKIDKKSSFIFVSSTMKNDTLAKLFCERLVDYAVKNYVEIKTARQRSVVDKLQTRVDSLNILLKNATFKSANLQSSAVTMDLNPLFKTSSNFNIENTQRDKSLITSIFVSATQNLELSKFALSQNTPLIQIVDSPTFPLKSNKISLLKYILATNFIALCIFFGYLILLTYFRQIPTS